MNLTCYVTTTPNDAISLYFIQKNDYSNWIKEQNVHEQTWLKANGFNAESGTFCLIPNAKGDVESVVVGLKDENDFWAAGALPKALPAGHYFIAEGLQAELRHLIELSWGLGAYQFTRYKKPPEKPPAQLVINSEEASPLSALVDAVYTVRDLINTPTENMGPSDVAEAASQISQTFSAEFQQWEGDELLNQGFPLVHLVGRASLNKPRLIELKWGNPNHPRLTLIGKGVCFDSGGLDLKQSHNMRTMKKDMGGAAHVLGLAKLIMHQSLPVRLRVIIPAVENVISGSAYKPGDIVKSRQRLTVEIGNTDAEGRLILADALTYASEDNPDLIIDIATLTGAARVALGTDIAVMFCNDETVSHELMNNSKKTQDPIWPLPLYQPYRKLIDSPIADIENSGSSPYGGAITAALFLQEFVKKNISWVHFDVMAWNVSHRPGRPEGGEAMGLRTVFAYLQDRYGLGSAR